MSCAHKWALESIQCTGVYKYYVPLGLYLNTEGRSEFTFFLPGSIAKD